MRSTQAAVTLTRWHQGLARKARVLLPSALLGIVLLSEITAASAQVPSKSSQAPVSATSSKATVCKNCGVIEIIRQITTPVANTDSNLIGTFAGGVAGGVIGNQFGGGYGKGAFTALGAVGGALAGREIERNIKPQQTVTHFELTVRMNDGSVRVFRLEAPISFASGDHVKVENGQLYPR